MNTRETVVHMVGVIVALSVLYHSREGFLALGVIMPVALVSIGERMENKSIQILGLGVVSFIIPYLISSRGMGELSPLIFFIVTLAVPLVLYWGITLSSSFTPDHLALINSGTYLVTVLLTFYLFTFIFDIGEYVLDASNTAPQSLILIASSLLVLMPYYIYVELKHF